MTSPAPLSAPPRRDRDPAIALAVFAPIAAAARHVAMFAYFDPKWRLLGMRHLSAARADAAAVSVRDVVGDALAFGCAAVVMAHNHPGGDPSPSAADYAATRKLARALEVMGVRLVDHLVLTGDGCESFRERGLL